MHLNFVGCAIAFMCTHATCCADLAPATGEHVLSKGSIPERPGPHSQGRSSGHAFGGNRLQGRAAAGGAEVQGKACVLVGEAASQLDRPGTFVALCGRSYLQGRTVAGSTEVQGTVCAHG